MQPASASTCKICYFPFDSDERIPVVGHCGHTCCASCTNHFMNGNCPTCRRTGAFKNAPTNFTLLEMIQEESTKDWSKQTGPEANDCTEPSAPPLEEDESDKPLLPRAPTPTPSVMIIVPPASEEDFEDLPETNNEATFCTRNLVKIILLLTVVATLLVFAFCLIEWWWKTLE